MREGKGEGKGSGRGELIERRDGKGGYTVGEKRGRKNMKEKQKEVHALPFSGAFAAYGRRVYLRVRCILMSIVIQTD